MQQSQDLIDIDRLLESKAPKLKKWLPLFIINYIKRITHQTEVNAFIDGNRDKNALQFSEALREKFDIRVDIRGLENIPKTGGCIAVSNHPLGGLDAIAIIPEIQTVRTDLKYIVNDMLLSLKQLSEIFVGVDKVGKSTRDSLKKVEEVFASDQLIMLFPAGMVSRKINGKITDLAWQKTFVSKSKKYNKPIIPIYTEGALTPFFYRLSNLRKAIGIKANVEMIYLADEMFKQHGKTIKYRIGKPIYVNELPKEFSNQEICAHVRKELYNLAD